MPLPNRITPAGTTWCFQVTANESDCLVVFCELPDSSVVGGEITFRWAHVGDEWVPRLECWDDAWLTLGMSGLVWLLGEWAGRAVSLATFVEALKGYGFADRSTVPNPTAQRPANGAEMAVAGLDGQGEVIDAAIVQEVLRMAADLEGIISTGDLDADSCRRLTLAVAGYRQSLIERLGA